METDHREAEPRQHWTLWREDIYGNQFRVPVPCGNEEEAILARDEFRAKGHHQIYFTKSMDIDDDTDFIPAKK